MFKEKWMRRPGKVSVCFVPALGTLCQGFLLRSEFCKLFEKAFHQKGCLSPIKAAAVLPILLGKSFSDHRWFLGGGRRKGKPEYVRFVAGGALKCCALFCPIVQLILPKGAVGEIVVHRSGPNRDVSVFADRG